MNASMPRLKAAFEAAGFTQVVTVPDIILIAGTRVALGVGIGLLVSKRLREEAREGAGWALLAIGALTTIPPALKLRTASRAGDREHEAMGGRWEQRPLHGASLVHPPP
jgi:hypothetical protein